MTSPLSDRLRAAFGSSLQATIASSPRSAAIRPVASELPGVEFQTEAGPCLVVETRYPLDHSHGGLELGACLALPPLGLVCLAKDPALGQVDLRQVVFLDTETTGLAGGTGTTAFLVGIASFRSDPIVGEQLVVRQLFMRDFGEERAMLLALVDELTPFRYVVTFNGKSFDLPLLETRYTLARLSRRRWQPERHFDLLHPARRLWRELLGGCSLAILEEAVLGHRREADVPSWAIPGLYAAYLRLGESGPLQRVFSHNRHDLLSLAALATRLAHRLAAPLTSGLGPEELLAIGRLYNELGLGADAIGCLELALAQAEPPLRTRIALLLARLYRRRGRYDEAQALWGSLARGAAALTGLVELAKHHEHRGRDPRAALEYVEQALVVLELREARDGAPRWRAERMELERRYARLRRKCGAR